MNEHERAKTEEIKEYIKLPDFSPWEDAADLLGQLTDTENLAPRLFFIPSEALHQLADPKFKELVHDFFCRLGDNSFYMRFGSHKNNTTIGNKTDLLTKPAPIAHDTLVFMMDGMPAAASSIFKVPYKDTARGIDDSESVVELALTVQDDYQGMGVGTALISKTLQVAAQRGAVYSQATFVDGNTNSRHVAEKLLHETLVAGSHNPDTKYYYIAGQRILALEESMRRECRDYGPPREFVQAFGAHAVDATSAAA